MPYLHVNQEQVDYLRRLVEDDIGALAEGIQKHSGNPQQESQVAQWERELTTANHLLSWLTSLAKLSTTAIDQLLKDLEVARNVVTMYYKGVDQATTLTILNVLDHLMMVNRD